MCVKHCWFYIHFYMWMQDFCTSNCFKNCPFLINTLKLIIINYTLPSLLFFHNHYSRSSIIYFPSDSMSMYHFRHMIIHFIRRSLPVTDCTSFNCTTCSRCLCIKLSNCSALLTFILTLTFTLLPSASSHCKPSKRLLHESIPTTKQAAM